MFSTDLKTPGFRLRPLELRDIEALTNVIFGDPDVAKTLAHDASTAESRRKCAAVWCERHAIDSPQSNWTQRRLGAWALVDEAAGKSAERLIGIRGFNVDKNLPENCVGTFIALAKSHWQRGLASEITRLLLDYVFHETDTKAVYTEIWPLLNPRSEAVQRKMGYELVGRHSVREAHGEDRMRDIAKFELWRALCASDSELAPVLREVSVKMGQLAAERLHSQEEAVDLILGQIAVPDQTVDELVQGNVQLGFDNPAWLEFRLNRSDWLHRQQLR